MYCKNVCEMDQYYLKTLFFIAMKLYKKPFDVGRLHWGSFDHFSMPTTLWQYNSLGCMCSILVYSSVWSLDNYMLLPICTLDGPSSCKVKKRTSNHTYTWFVSSHNSSSVPVLGVSSTEWVHFPICFTFYGRPHTSELIEGSKKTKINTCSRWTAAVTVNTSDKWKSLEYHFCKGGLGNYWTGLTKLICTN